MEAYAILSWLSAVNASLSYGTQYLRRGQLRYFIRGYAIILSSGSLSIRPLATYCGASYGSRPPLSFLMRPNPSSRQEPATER